MWVWLLCLHTLTSFTLTGWEVDKVHILTGTPVGLCTVQFRPLAWQLDGGVLFPNWWSFFVCKACRPRKGGQYLWVSTPGKGWILLSEANYNSLCITMFSYRSFCSKQPILVEIMVTIVSVRTCMFKCMCVQPRRALHTRMGKAWAFPPNLERAQCHKYPQQFNQHPSPAEGWFVQNPQTPSTYRPGVHPWCIR